MGMAKRPTYCGCEVIRVEREYCLLGRYRTSMWYLVALGDNGHEATVAVSAGDADHYGATLPTVTVNTPRTPRVIAA